MSIHKIDHIHVYVRDLDSATDFFARILGTACTQSGNLDEYSLRGAFHPVGLELIESTSPDGIVAKHIEKRGEGVAAICFKVTDIEGVIAHLQAQGLRLVGRVEHSGLKEATFHPRDSHGVMIELCEYDGENILSFHPQAPND